MSRHVPLLLGSALTAVRSSPAWAEIGDKVAPARAPGRSSTLAADVRRQFIVLLGIAGLLFIVPGSAAWAEVCDKEVPAWSSGDPAVGWIGESVRYVSSGFGVATVVLSAAAFAAHRYWAYVAGAGMAGLFAVHVLIDWRYFDSVFADAVEEGCRAPPLLVLAATVTLASWMAVAAFRRRRLAG